MAIYGNVMFTATKSFHPNRRWMQLAGFPLFLEKKTHIFHRIYRDLIYWVKQIQSTDDIPFDRLLFHQTLHISTIIRSNAPAKRVNNDLGLQIATNSYVNGVIIVVASGCLVPIWMAIWSPPHLLRVSIWRRVVWEIEARKRCIDTDKPKRWNVGMVDFLLLADKIDLIRWAATIETGKD